MTAKVLLQTTIIPTPNDWDIARFGLLASFLREQGFNFLVVRRK